MILKKLSYLTLTTVLLIGTGCSSGHVVKEGQYWQRIHASEMAYTQGPKAQQLLNRNISMCVAELQELERLGTIKNAIPVDYSGRVLNPDEQTMREWETPERDGELLSEHMDYHDFETCMLAKGWERVKHVPYDVAEKSRKAYLDAHTDYEYQSRYAPNRSTQRRRTSTDAAGLNE